MSELVMRIEQCIKKKGTNFKRVENACGLGNGTIKRWSDQSPRLDKLIAVAEHLQVSLDYLVYGNLQTEIFTSDRFFPDALDKIEFDLVTMFRLLDERGQEDVIDYITMKYEKTTGERGSIYLTYIEDEKEQKRNESPQDEKGQDGSA